MIPIFTLTTSLCRAAHRARPILGKKFRIFCALDSFLFVFWLLLSMCHVMMDTTLPLNVRSLSFVSSCLLITLLSHQPISEIPPILQNPYAVLGLCKATFTIPIAHI